MDGCSGEGVGVGGCSGEGVGCAYCEVVKCDIMVKHV